jgi:hypothetical protein
MDVELGSTNLLKCSPLEERRGGENIAMRLNLHLRSEVPLEELTDRHFCKGPTPVISPLPSINLANAWYGQEKNATWSQGA